MKTEAKSVFFTKSKKETIFTQGYHKSLIKRWNSVMVLRLKKVKRESKKWEKEGLKPIYQGMLLK